MAKTKGGVVLLPWYATLFRQDRVAAALAETSPLSRSE